MSKKIKIDLQILNNRLLNTDIHLLTLTGSCELAGACRPGQFLNVRALDSTAPLLRRPISIMDARPESGEVDLLVKSVGEGTRQICSRRPGAVLDVMGPLGNAFEAAGKGPMLMIGGGVGVAPLYYLSKWIERQNQANGTISGEIIFCYGARSECDFVMLSELQECVGQLVLTTEDGARGAKGYVTAAAEKFMEKDAQIFVCGPTPMMDAVRELLDARGLRGQISLENQMGCGVGACQGCVVQGRHRLIRVCCDGPVVWSDEL